MIPVVVENFLSTYPSLKSYSDTADFVDEVNPVDDVTYPLICKDIPDDVQAEVIKNLTLFLGRDPDINVIFMRRSPEGVDVPHISHTDNS